VSEYDHIPMRTALERLPSERMHPLVQAAMAQGQMDPATLRELLALQREWQAGEARRAYTVALVGLKRDLPSVIRRDQLVSFGGGKGQVAYRHTSLAAAVDAITPHLQAHGFAHSWHPSTPSRGEVAVTCRLTHAAGHSEEVTLTSAPDSSGSKSPGQSIASTITLLSRYALLALLGVATADMPEDGDQAVDAGRNLRAVAALREAGIPLDQAESAAGAPVSEWTTAHLDLVRELVRSRKALRGGPSPRRTDDTLDAEAVPVAERGGGQIDPMLAGLEEPDA
jgi:hypothetical protein